MPPVRPVDGAVRWFHESFVPGKIAVGWSCADYIFPSAPRIGIQPLPSPHRTWPVPDASSQSQLNLKTDLAKEKDLC